VGSKHTDQHAWLPEQDSRFIERVVGYDEYCECLRNLEQLVRLSNQSQLKAIDEYIQMKDEYVVYTNLARRFETKPSKLSEPRLSPNDDFARRGLPWVMALARVEVGAMLAGFSSVKRPMLAVNPTAIERNAYRELLLDGMRTHYLHLYQDVGYEKLNIGPNRTPRQLAYIRRLHMMEEFADAFESLGAREVLTPQPFQEFRSCCREVEQGCEELVTEICDRVRNNQRRDVAEVTYNDYGMTAPCPYVAQVIRLRLYHGDKLHILPAKPNSPRTLPARGTPPTTPTKPQPASQNQPVRTGGAKPTGVK